MASDRLRRALSALVFLALSALPALALAAEPSAADKETARALMEKGDAQMDVTEYAGALKSFTAAHAIMNLPVTGAAQARAQAALGLLTEARDLAMAVARSAVQPGESPAQGRARAEAATLANALAARIPSLQVVLTASPAPPEGLAVTVDGAPIAAAAATEIRKVNPGPHVVVVSAPGFKSARVEVTVKEGEALRVPVALERGAAAPVQPPPPPVQPPPLPSPPARSPLVWIGFGVAGAGFVAGGISGGVSIAKTKALTCTGSVCAGQDDAIRTANTLANVSNVTLGVGLAGAVVGVIGLVISRPAPPAAARVEPFIGPGALGLRGVF